MFWEHREQVVNQVYIFPNYSLQCYWHLPCSPSPSAIVHIKQTQHLTWGLFIIKVLILLFISNTFKDAFISDFSLCLKAINSMVKNTGCSHGILPFLIWNTDVQQCEHMETRQWAELTIPSWSEVEGQVLSWILPVTQKIRPRTVTDQWVFCPN